MGYVISYLLSVNIKERQGLQGDKGIRGNRGKKGKDKSCKPLECQKGICNIRLMKYINNVYTQYLIEKKILVNGQQAQIANNFILNKIKLLCGSTQLKKLIKNKGSQYSYLYIQNKIKKGYM